MTLVCTKKRLRAGAGGAKATPKDVAKEKHLFFDEFLNDDMTFRTEDELRGLLEDRGAMPDRDVISYCRLSHRATLAYFTMTQLLGYENVRSYDGSWTEWGGRPDTPIVLE